MKLAGHDACLHTASIAYHSPPNRHGRRYNTPRSTYYPISQWTRVSAIAEGGCKAHLLKRYRFLGGPDPATVFKTASTSTYRIPAYHPSAYELHPAAIITPSSCPLLHLTLYHTLFRLLCFLLPGLVDGHAARCIDGVYGVSPLFLAVRAKQAVASISEFKWNHVIIDIRR